MSPPPPRTAGRAELELTGLAPGRRGDCSPSAPACGCPWPWAEQLVHATGGNPLTQDQRGLIPLLLDGDAAEPWVSAQRLYGPENHRVTLPDSACGKTRLNPPGARLVQAGELIYATD